MTPTQSRMVQAEQSRRYAEAKALCERNDIRLSRDPIDGYWLHFDGKMKFIRAISNIPGWIDWIQSGN